MAETRTELHSTSPENFQQSYGRLSEPDKALINAMMRMSFALLTGIQQVQNNANSQRG